MKTHDEFLELCAVSTSGQLTEEENQRLQEHLSDCSSCWEAMRQFDSVVRDSIPAIASEKVQEDLESAFGWSQEQAEADLFNRLAQPCSHWDRDEQMGDLRFKDHALPLASSSSTWRNIWTLYATGIVLSIALALSLYQLGLHRGAKPVSSSARTDATNISVDRQLSDGKNYEPTRAQIEEHDRVIAGLRLDLQRQVREMNRIKLAQNVFEADLSNAESARQGLIQDRVELARRANAAEFRLQATQAKLDSAEKQAAQDAAAAVSLQIKVNDLAQTLKDRDQAIKEKDDLLSHDSDIRELMGARELYIAEVYDVASTGTQKPFGRIFYTRGKSLIFYAYDLDQQSRAKNANTFQAWGMKGTDRHQALSLGIFYEDNTSKKRWVLRSTDPNALEKLDAVFVTVEQNGGSHSPSGKPLMFAYLKIAANHP